MGVQLKAIPRMNSSRYLAVLESPWYRVLVDVQSVITTSTIDFFRGEGLRAIHLPITTHSISSPMGLGSDSLPVKIELCGVPTYLADSMQFMLEYGCRLSDKGAYYVMPSFRGEDADESHLCQFYHSEAEIPGGLDDVMSLVERYVRFMTRAIHDACGREIGALVGDMGHIERLLDRGPAFPRVAFQDAIERFSGQPGMTRNLPDDIVVLTRAAEQRLLREHDGFVWLTHPDHRSVPFYQAYADPEGKRALAADLLFGLGEVVGCGERHVTMDEVVGALERHHVHPEPYRWYFEMRERYPMQTSGFGLGTERYICWLLKHDDIRDCQLLERYNGIPTIP